MSRTDQTIEVKPNNVTASAIFAAGQGSPEVELQHLRNTRDAAGLLRRAWLELQVPQCGYCQSGQMMNAAAFLDSNPSPSDGEILEAMQGNLCRCITYVRIKQGVRRASEIMGA